MKLNEKALEKIDKKYSALHLEDKTYMCGLGIDVRDAMHGATVYGMNGQTIICELKDLSQMIYELTMMKKAVEDATGLMV